MALFQISLQAWLQIDIEAELQVLFPIFLEAAGYA